jgi:hypothetical protein
MALTAAEDGDLRRLAAFDAIGMLDAHGQMRLRTLRAQDRRSSVRPVTESVEQFAPLRHTDPGMRVRRCSIYPTW